MSNLELYLETMYTGSKNAGPSLLCSKDLQEGSHFLCYHLCLSDHLHLFGEICLLFCNFCNTLLPYEFFYTISAFFPSLTCVLYDPKRYWILLMHGCSSPLTFSFFLDSDISLLFELSFNDFSSWTIAQGDCKRPCTINASLVHFNTNLKVELV